MAEKRKWTLPLCGCIGYRNAANESKCTPLFCPVSVLCTGYVAGAIVSKLHNERPCCFDLGCRGFLCCCLTIPIHVGSPLGGMSMFACLSCYLREQVIQKYNVEEDHDCYCGPLNPYVEPLHIHCNYPCSFFQMYMSIQDWDYAESRRVVVIDPVVAIPIASPVHN